MILITICIIVQLRVGWVPNYPICVRHRSRRGEVCEGHIKPPAPPRFPAPWARSWLLVSSSPTPFPPLLPAASWPPNHRGDSPGLALPTLFVCETRAKSQGSLKEEGLWLGNQSLLSHYQNVLQQRHQPLTVSRRDAVKVQHPRLLSRQRCTFPTGPEGGRKTTLSPVSPYFPSSMVPEEPHML